MYKGIIITHGTMASCLVRTLKKISGIKTPIEAVSNEGKTADQIVDDLLIRYPVGEDTPLFVFSEFKGGSTWFAANKFANLRKNVFVFTGVNLPMLISFETKQDELDAEQLAEAVFQDGNRGITRQFYGEQAGKTKI